MKKMVASQRFDVLLVEKGELLAKAQALRSQEFLNQSGKKEEDTFDKFCKHLITLEKETGRVVGNYRLLLGNDAQKQEGFFAERQFDLAKIKENCRGELLEMGRACVDRAYRKYPIINLMWKAIIFYIKENEVNYVFGSASIKNHSPEIVAKAFRYLKNHCYCPSEFQVYPLAGVGYAYAKEIENYSEGEAKALFSPLIKGYLKMGAWVCSEPALNRAFGTVIFFMLLDTKKMNLSYKSKFL